MFLTRMIYASTMSEGIGPEAIEHILNSARKNNKTNNVTGGLIFNRKYFLQCLEGSRTMVNQTYNRILQDTRHKDVILVDYSEICCREFSEWDMFFVPETKITKPLILKYSGTDNFDPYKMKGQTIYNFMKELSELMDS